MAPGLALPYCESAIQQQYALLRPISEVAIPARDLGLVR